MASDLKKAGDKLIIIVDDNPDIVNMVSIDLRGEGFSVKGCSNAKALFKSLDKEKPDLIILDIVLPDMDGFNICRKLKKSKRLSSIPVIMLTLKDAEDDRVSGLDIGADDYIGKPFSSKELKARIRAVLRRQEAEGEVKTINVGNIVTMDPENHEVKVGKKKAGLTTTEFRILECLASGKNRTFTRDRILEYLWGDEKVVTDRTIDVHVRHLRKKLGRAGKFIKNIRGLGYKIEEK
ncbi:response regulator transcription factor [Omnitrophica bacterium]|nr:response regulator transcription factor [Candidatus Omnitrophota bacterium]